MKTTTNAAADRVDSTPELAPYRTILVEYDWGTNDHLVWVATAPVEEILSWAKAVEASE